jgi:hypothetical protein
MVEGVAWLLQWIFTYIFYPVIVVLVFLAIWGHIAAIVAEGSEYSSKFRRSVGGLLPLICLIFGITQYPESNQSISGYIQSIPASIQVLTGVVLGVGIIECGKIASKTDSDVGAAIYALFESSIGTLLLYCFMKSALGGLNTFLRSFLMGGGIYVIFRKF